MPVLNSLSHIMYMYTVYKQTDRYNLCADKDVKNNNFIAASKPYHCGKAKVFYLIHWILNCG